MEQLQQTKRVIDRISQPNWSVVIVYSDWTTKVDIRKSSLKNTLIQVKKWGIKKKNKVN